MKRLLNTIETLITGIALLLSLSFLPSCSEDSEIPQEIIANSTTISSSISNLDTYSVTILGQCSIASKAKAIALYYGTTNPPTSKTRVSVTGNNFSVNLTDLFPNTKYYYYVLVEGEGKMQLQSPIKDFTTADIQLPTVTTADITSITRIEAISGGDVTSDGGDIVMGRGVVWSTSENPTIDLTTKTADGEGTGTFTSAITGLTAETTYYVRAYATNIQGTSYGEQKSFTTSSIVAPTITTTNITSLTATEVVLGGDVTSDGGEPITARGVVWSTSENPTVNLTTKTTDGTGTGTFVSIIPGLTSETTYYVRAYATNSEGTSYGEQKLFMTPSATYTVRGVTLNMVDVTGGTFTMGATNEQVSEAAADESPTHTVTLSSYSIGQFEVTQGLWEAVMRSNPSNNTGDDHLPVENVTWGDVNTFITELKLLTGLSFSLPTEAQWEFAARGGDRSQGYKYSGSNTLNDVAWYGDNSSNLTHPIGTKQPNELGIYDMTGNVSEWCNDWYASYDGNSQTNPIGYPTGQHRIIRGGGFTHQASDCRVSRRFNQDPTEFSTNSGFRLAIYSALNVTTADITSVTLTQAISGGEVLTVGDSRITARGVVWSTSENPTVDLPTKTIDGDRDGAFTSTITGLTAETTYYVRAYATNNEGTAYGEQKIFATPSDIYTVGEVSFNMIYVSGGSFTMGATSEQEGDSFSSEYPIHTVTLSPYYISQYEVTQGLWKAVMGSNPSYFTRNDNLPVEQVSWNDAQEFITALNNLTGKRFVLPTEAQWEFAARGGNRSRGYKYSGSNSISDVGWYDDNSLDISHPVGSKQPNELGIYDMSGNVLEWCSDRYDSYSSNSQTDPTGATSEGNRVLRGGNWRYSANHCRVSSRFNNGPDTYDNAGGFRIALHFNPTITTAEITSITASQAISGGEVLAEGDSPVTERGVVWSTSENPTVDLTTKTIDGSGSGAFTSTITGLMAETTYYVRAYATNSFGTSYGEQKSFYTPSVTYRVGGISFNMINVARGTFTMGATKEQVNDADEDEYPTHSVALSSYSIGQYEVTTGLWRAVMDSNPPHYTGDDNLPVRGISWNDAQTFITALNTLTGKTFALPTEAQWEFAARGGNRSRGYKYSGSHSVDDVAWCDEEDAEGETHIVGTKQPNELGIYDMSGNVVEWCYDWYGDYSSDSQTDPTGPTTGTWRVIRGGGIYSDSDYCRVSDRDYVETGMASYGFRIVLLAN